MKVTLSAQAEEDLTGIAKYINDDLRNPIAAHNIVDKVLRAVQKLSQFPELGADLKRVEVALDAYRYLIADNYLILYRIAEQEVFVVRILYARSDYVRLLHG